MLLKSQFSNHNTIIMFQNNIKIAWRNLKNQRFYSIIKIGGFAFSMAICLLIVLYIQHELSYDKFYKDSNQIFRVVGVITRDNVVQKGVSMPAPAGPELKEEFPEITAFGRVLSNPLFGAGSNQVATNENPELFSEEGFCFVDQGIMDMFRMETVFGTLNHALDNPNTIVITKSKAEKLFKGDPIGKIIYLNNDKSKGYSITAVIDDIPTNSNFYGFDFFMTLSGHEPYPGEKQNWLASNYSTYFKVKDGTDITQLEKKLTRSYIDDHYRPAVVQAGMAVNEEIWKSAKMTLQPLKDIHLHSKGIQNNKIENQNRGDAQLVYIFAGIAALILIIAIINFINLSTANANTRAKEVCVRKTIGSDRSSLIWQFITESLLYSLISILIAIAIAYLLLPYFNGIAGKSLTFPWKNLVYIPSLLFFGCFIGIISGVYPALYLSSFKPIAVLKGKLNLKSGNNWFRNGLVVFQFSTSIILIIGTLIINQQVKYILHKDLGFNKEQVLVLRGTGTLDGKQKAMKEELKGISTVSSVSVGDYLPVMMDGVRRNGNAYWIDGRQNEDVGIGGQNWLVDVDYLKTFGIKLIEGRNFNMEMPTDSTAVVVNQSMVRELGITNPIGAKIRNFATFTIIGVVEDFIFGDMKGEAVKPLALMIGGSPNMISIKLNTNNLEQTLAEINKVWNSFSPNQKIQYTFLDEGFENLYADVQRTQAIVSTFALFAIFIACLGLFGLAAFVTQQRTKEIGIRKVLGASLPGIIKLLSTDFIKLVFIAIIIASPIAWWAMNNWLKDFSYRIDIKPWVFLAAGGISLFIAFCTICYHALRIGRINPVNSLKDE